MNENRDARRHDYLPIIKKKKKNLGFSRLKTQTFIYYVMFLRREIGLIEIIS